MASAENISLAAYVRLTWRGSALKAMVSKKIFSVKAEKWLLSAERRKASWRVMSEMASAAALAWRNLWRGVANICSIESWLCAVKEMGVTGAGGGKP
jgi:hypothetical protein